MKKLLFNISLMLAFVLAFSLQGLAQYTPGKHYLIKTQDAGTIIGELVESTPDYLLVKTTSLGEVKVDLKAVESVKEIDPARIVDGKYWFENPHATRNLYGPTGYGLRKGEGYYQNTWIVLNTVSYGFTDWLTIGAGMEFVSFFNEGNVPVFIITPKVSFPIIENKLNAGGGILYVNATSLAEDSEAQFGIVYGVGTYGSKDNNVTLGLGWGYNGYDGIAQSPTVTLSGTLRTGRSFGLVTENWFLTVEGELITILSFGARYLGEKVAIDLALVVPVIDGDGVALPWLGVAIPFGGK